MAQCTTKSSRFFSHRKLYFITDKRQCNDETNFFATPFFTTIFLKKSLLF